MLTGEYPPIHGVRTSLDKTGNCSELKIDEVPTLGHYLSKAGYDVVYKGEWGLSEVQAMLEHPILDLLGVERNADEDLQPFGFQGWEAHMEEDWYARSIQITNEAVEYIRRRECVMSSESLRGSEPPPWALVVSYPDIVPDWNEMKNEMREQLVDLSHPVWSDAQMNTSFSCGNLRQMELQRRNLKPADFVKGKVVHVKVTEVDERRRRLNLVPANTEVDEEVDILVRDGVRCEK